MIAAANAVPQPIMADSVIRMRPSPSLRAAILADVPGLPAEARTFWFECETGDRHQPTDCIPVSSPDARPGKKPGSLAANWDAFLERGFEAAKQDDPLQAAARKLLDQYRIEPQPILSGSYADWTRPVLTRPILISETLSAADAKLDLDPDAPELPSTEVIWAPQGDDPLINSYFSPRAQRAGVAVTLLVDCWIGKDLGLTCRNLREADNAHTIDAEMLSLFAPLTYQSIATLKAQPQSRSGIAVAGKRVTIRLHFVSGPKP